MGRILGLDEGTNSIGWAIRDDSLVGNQIVDAGVITFNKGVASEKGIEYPKVQKRTESRGRRRNYQAEKYRKWNLLKFLIDKGMCPLTHDELKKWKGYTKGIKRQYPKSESFINWLRFDFDGDGKPDFHLFGRDKHESYYVFRALVIDRKYVEIFNQNPHILGRVLYQLVQRRGFRGRDEEEARTMLEGSNESNTPGREEISEYIQQYKTLGAALYYFQKEKGVRIRRRYNLRKDYESELKQICEVHQLSDKDYHSLWRSIIWQRPLRTQKGLIGNCIYEKNKKRIQVSHPLYEEYRTWVFINNLKIKVPDSIEKSDYLQNVIYPIFYKASNDFKLISIRRQLDADGASMESNFRDDTKVLSAKLLHSFQNVLGPDWKENYEWNSIHIRESQPKKKVKGGYSYEDIWHVLNTFEGKEYLEAFARDKLKLPEDRVEKFSKIRLNSGYATLSLSAIKKILPYLRLGFLYSQAVYMANLHKVLGEEQISKESIDVFANEIEIIIKKHQFENIVNKIVNSLIQDAINEKYRYSIEKDRDLDDDEVDTIFNKIKHVIGNNSWLNLSTHDKEELFKSVSLKYKEFLRKSILDKKNVFIATPRLDDQIFKYFQQTYDIAEENKRFLWHPADQEVYPKSMEYRHYELNEKNIYVLNNNWESFIESNPTASFQGRIIELLGSPVPMNKGFKNPMALKTMHKLRKLLNYLLKSGKIDEDTRVVIEIARELNDNNKRKAIENWNREREKENEKYRKIIREINSVSGTNYNENDNVLLKKLRLWEEQKGVCMYTGKSINRSDVFNASLYDIEHTIPASISFDNELKNLTLASSNFNRNIKGNKLPTQLLNYEQSSTINGILYNSIVLNIQNLFGEIRKVKAKKNGKEFYKISSKKIDDLEALYFDWKNKATWASTKGYKDFCIQKYHEIKMDLDYWRSKLNTFIMVEYKSSWRNSQLRDTQLVTKYTLPYLKTVFKHVSVEKSTVVNSFKEIYKVKLNTEKKSREIHSHHAIDAAVLTLIPPFYNRDKILLRYFNEIDKKTGNTYHELPQDWKDFSPSFIKEIEEKVLINNLNEDRTITKTFKKVRRRGKIQWLDSDKKNPKIAQGDTIRGQLHEESLYGAIKEVVRDEDNKILFDKERKMILKEKPTLVIRKELVYKKDSNSPGFNSLSEIKKVIVDQALFKMIEKQVKQAEDFKSALGGGVFMLNKNGEKVNRIRHIRCKVSTMKYETAIKVHSHSFKSKKEHKQFTLAKNGENALCLFYQEDSLRSIRILSISEVAKTGFCNDQKYFTEPFYNNIEVGRGKSKIKIPLYAILRTGHKVLFYVDSKEELLELSKSNLSKRLYKVHQFEADGRIKLRHHLVAGTITELNKKYKEYSVYDSTQDPTLLRISKREWNFAIDGIDFKMNIDGEIDWML